MPFQFVDIDHPKDRGYTLIEMSIVLVIIGLIVGGILVGQNLIHSAKIRYTVSQYERFNTATNTFIGKYNCLPGDCANATTFNFTDQNNSTLKCAPKFGQKNGGAYRTCTHALAECFSRYSLANSSGVR